MQGKESKDASTAGAAAPTIERQTTSRKELCLYATLLIVFDVGKMITCYSLKYFNDDKYPVAQTIIIFLTEIAKLAAMCAALVYTQSYRDVSLSLKFAIPSVLYAVNNNLYLYAFHYTTPAVWNILTQSRIVITAIVYRAFFKKQISMVQWLSLVLLTFAISLTQLAGNSGAVFIKPAAFFIASLCSVFSVMAGVFIEYSFKNDKRSFIDQQLQLCLFAAIASLLLYEIEVKSSQISVFWTGGSSLGALLPVLFVTCVLLGAISGLVTGIVIKKLDNIVKIYSQSLCGIVNAILCMLLFPNKFSPDWHYFVALVLVIASILMYETGCSFKQGNEHSKNLSKKLDRSTISAL